MKPASECSPNGNRIQPLHDLNATNLSAHLSWKISLITACLFLPIRYWLIRGNWTLNVEVDHQHSNPHDLNTKNVFKWANHGLFLFIFVLFKYKFYRNTFDSSRIWTRIVSRDGEHADHLDHNHGPNCKNVSFNSLLVVTLPSSLPPPPPRNVDSCVQHVPSTDWKHLHVVKREWVPSGKNLNIFVTEVDEANKPLISSQIRKALFHFLSSSNF